MFRFGIIAVVSSAALAACAPQKMTYAEAFAFCKDKADAAAGPQGEVGLSIGTGGTNASLSISVSDSFLRGDDPQVVFETCMNEFTLSGRISGVTE